MPTELPSKTTISPASSSDGTLAFLLAVVLMLAISTIMLMHPDSGDVASVDTQAQAKTF